MILHSGLLNEIAIFPSQDTAVIFDLFSYLNNNLSDSGIIPTWNFHALYGQRFEYWLTSFSPIMVICSYFGKIIGANDNYNLYLLSLFLEKIIFIFGAYLLCRRLNIDKRIIFLTLCTFIFTWIWSTSINNNFRGIYTYPFFLLFGFDFLKQGKISSILLSGLSLAVTMVGNVGYYAPLMLFHFIIYTFSLFIGRFFLSKEKKEKNIIVINNEMFFSILISSLMLLTYFLFGVTVFTDPNIEFLRPGRDESMKIILETVPSAFDLRLKEAILQIITGLPLGKFQPLVNIGTIGTFGVISTFLLRNKINYLQKIFLLTGWFTIISWLVICQVLVYYPEFINFIPLFGYLRQTEIILAFLKIHMIFTSAIGIEYIINQNKYKPSKELKIKGKESLNISLFAIKISTLLFIASIIYMFFDRGNIRSLPNVFAANYIADKFWNNLSNIDLVKFFLDNSIFYYFSIKIVLLISLYFIFKRIVSFKKYDYVNLIVIIAVFELSLNYVVLNFRENNFIKTSSIENIRKISELKDPIPLSNFKNSIDSLEKKFRPFSASYWSQGVSTCAPRTGNDSISPRLIKLMREVWGYDEELIRSIMTGSSYNSQKRDTKLFEKKYTLCDTGKIIRNSEKIIVTKNSDESALSIKKMGDDFDFNDVDIIEDNSGSLKNKIKKLAPYPFEISPKFGVNKIELDLIKQKNPYILYMAMNYDNKWKIKSDNKDSKIYPANLTFTGIYIPANTSKVDLTFESGLTIKLFKLMILSSTISILLVLIKSIPNKKNPINRKISNI